MRYRDSVFILKACQMSFNGVKNNDIADQLGVTPSDVSRWRKLPLWKEFHDELFEVEKKALLDAQTQFRSRAEVKSSAQG